MATTREKIEHLTNLALIDDTEWSEYILCLTSMHQFSSFMDEKFQEELVREINDQYEYAIEHCSIIEEPQTFTKMVKTLEWLD